jgi:hypothetical protein
MNLLRNSLLMRKTGDRRRTELTEIFAFLCGFPAEFITRSRILDTRPLWSRPTTLLLPRRSMCCLTRFAHRLQALLSTERCSYSSPSISLIRASRIWCYSSVLSLQAFGR